MDSEGLLHTHLPMFHNAPAGAQCWMVGLTYIQVHHVLGLCCCCCGCNLAHVPDQHMLFLDASLLPVADTLMMMLHVVHQVLVLDKSIVVALTVVHADNRLMLCMPYVVMIPLLFALMVPIVCVHGSA